MRTRPRIRGEPARARTRLAAILRAELEPATSNPREVCKRVRIAPGAIGVRIRAGPPGGDSAEPAGTRTRPHGRTPENPASEARRTPDRRRTTRTPDRGRTRTDARTPPMLITRQSHRATASDAWPEPQRGGKLRATAQRLPRAHARRDRNLTSEAKALRYTQRESRTHRGERSHTE